jgi:hypothetical protein
LSVAISAAMEQTHKQGARLLAGMFCQLFDVNTKNLRVKPTLHGARETQIDSKTPNLTGKSTQLNKHSKGFKSHLTCQIDYEATY